MTSTLPSRWQEILRREAAANVGTVLAQAKEQPNQRRFPRWTLPAAVVGVASLSLFTALGGTQATGRGTVPFDRSTVISTRSAGLGASAEDLAPRRTSPAAFERLSDLPSQPSLERQATSERSSVARREKPSEACPECERRRRAAMTALEATPAPDPTPEPSPSATPAPLVVNIGTRVEAVLTEPVVTGAALAPATATLAKDVIVGNRIAIPTGALLVGEGFATQQDDRAQVVFSAIVKDGKTIQLEGWALQDGEAGVKGRVVRKGSKGKGGAGALLGAAASGLSYGLGGALPGTGGAALNSLGNTAASDLSSLGHEWRRSDKVVRVEAGVPITVYIRRDVAVE